MQEAGEILDMLKSGEQKRLDEAKALQEKMEREKKALQVNPANRNPPIFFIVQSAGEEIFQVCPTNRRPPVIVKVQSEWEESSPGTSS